MAAPTSANPEPVVSGGSALRSPAAHLRFWLVAGLGLALDLWSKHWAFHTLHQGGRRVVIKHVLEFQTMMNSGALFGVGSGMTTLFLLASLMALGLVLWMFASSSRRNWLLHVALGGILAGAAGNMYDRINVQLVELRSPSGHVRFYETKTSDDGKYLRLYEYPAETDNEPIQRPIAFEKELPPAAGHVRDFIKIPTKFWGDQELWPWVFNVADMLLVGGVGILAIRLWRDRGHTTPKAADPPPPAKA